MSSRSPCRARRRRAAEVRGTWGGRHRPFRLTPRGARWGAEGSLRAELSAALGTAGWLGVGGGVRSWARGLAGRGGRAGRRARRLGNPNRRRLGGFGASCRLCGHLNPNVGAPLTVGVASRLFAVDQGACAAERREGIGAGGAVEVGARASGRLHDIRASPRHGSRKGARDGPSGVTRRLRRLQCRHQTAPASAPPTRPDRDRRPAPAATADPPRPRPAPTPPRPDHDRAPSERPALAPRAAPPPGARNPTPARRARTQAPR